MLKKDGFIIATIGQPSDNITSLRQILENKRVKYLRYNLSARIGYEVHRQRTDAARQLICDLGLAERVKIMYDLPFPATKVRIGMLPRSQHEVRAGDRIRFRSAAVSDDFSCFVPVEYPKLGMHVKINQIISIGDGELALKVDFTDNCDEFTAVCMCDGVIPCVKSLNIGVLQETFESKETTELLEFVDEMSPDCIVLSFIETEAQLTHSLVKLSNQLTNLKSMEVAAKLETPAGVSNARELAKHVDLLILGRGDLGVNSAPEEFGFLQNSFLEISQTLSIPTIVATQVIESSGAQYIPARSELSDLTNILMSGVRGILLAKETSANASPSRTLALVDKIMSKAESLH